MYVIKFIRQEIFFSEHNKYMSKRQRALSNPKFTKTVLKIGIGDASKSSKRYMSARFVPHSFYIQLQITHILIPLAKQLVNNRLTD